MTPPLIIGNVFLRQLRFDLFGGGFQILDHIGAGIKEDGPHRALDLGYQDGALQDSQRSISQDGGRLFLGGIRILRDSRCGQYLLGVRINKLIPEAVVVTFGTVDQHIAGTYSGGRRHILTLGQAVVHCAIFVDRLFIIVIGQLLL